VARVDPSGRSSGFPRGDLTGGRLGSSWRRGEAGYTCRLSERGLAASTVRYCTDEARGFLARREGRLTGLDAAEVSGFVADQCRRRSTGSAKIPVTALRSLLRFLVLEGLVTPGVQDAVPAVAGWRGGLPKALPDGQVAEASALELGDIDRRAGTVTVRGKRLMGFGC
jgi:hypothetical protein